MPTILLPAPGGSSVVLGSGGALDGRASALRTNSRPHGKPLFHIKFATKKRPALAGRPHWFSRPVSELRKLRDPVLGAWCNRRVSGQIRGERIDVKARLVDAVRARREVRERVATVGKEV